MEVCGYDVFISYAPQDTRIAARLQKLLQRHKYTETEGNRKRARRLKVLISPGPVPAAPDAELAEGTCQALAQSRFMVFICSKAAIESETCMKELDLFRKIHQESNDHILLLLAEGEPSEVFPKSICWKQSEDKGEDGKESLQKEEIEPLAANIRAKSDREQRKLLSREYLRLAAPVLGCGFDELYQRRKRRQRQWLGIVFAAVLTASACFWGYSSYMLEQLMEKERELEVNEALRLSSLSNEMCKNRDYRLAMLLAEQALFMDAKDPEKPLAPEAEAALRSAVMGQMIEQDNALVLQAVISFQASGWFICNTYAEGTRIAVCDYDNTYLYDAMTGKLLFQCHGMEVYFDDDGKIAVRATELLDEEGTVLIETFEVETGRLLHTEKTWVPLYDLELPYEQWRNPAFDIWQKEVDYSSENAKEMENTEIGKAAAYLNEWFYDVQTGIDTGDGELFIYDSPIGNIFWSRKEKKLVSYLLGTCYFDRESHLIYQILGIELYIYSYAPENFSQVSQEDTYNRISKDGKRLLAVDYQQDNNNERRAVLRIREEKVRSPYVLETELRQEEYTADGFLYYVTPYMDKIFYEDENGSLCLQETGGKVILSFCPEQDQKAVSLSVDESGQRIAIAVRHEDGKVSVELRLRDGSLTDRLDLSEYGDISISHMEFGGDRLLICTQEKSMLFDLTGEEKPKIFGHGNQEFHQDRYLTEDGLLFCTMETNSPYCLTAIYEIETGAQLWSQENMCRAYQYQEDTKTLVYQKLGTANTNRSVYIARRGKDGAFEDIHTIIPQETNMRLRTDDCTMDNRYFLLEGDDCCQVYDIFSGDEILTCSRTGYALVEGRLYNLNEYKQERLIRYSIMELDELSKYADAYLTSKNGRRELTEWEKEIYFIWKPEGT